MGSVENVGRPEDLDLGAWRLMTLPWAMARLVEMGWSTQEEIWRSLLAFVGCWAFSHFFKTCFVAN